MQSRHVNVLPMTLHFLLASSDNGPMMSHASLILDFLGLRLIKREQTTWTFSTEPTSSVL
jgi:hypothetical protein